MTVEQDFQLRICTVGDENKLGLVGAASFLEAFAGILPGENLLQHCYHEHSAEKYAYWLRSSSYDICAAEIKDAPVGYAMLCPPDLPIELTPDDIELKRIYLLHRFQGTGAGSALMRWAIEKSIDLGKKRLLLGVYAGNKNALAFYSRHGFEQVGTRQFVVGGLTCDDFILGRKL